MKINIKENRVIFLFILFSLLFLNSKAQVIQEVQNSFNLYKQSTLLEKIYVHTDKSVYLPGEILWFKVYAIDGNDDKPLNLSKVVYVDLLDNNQNRIAEGKVALKNGMGDGSIFIPVSISNGNYKFRAYTSWMKNFSPDFFFEKQLILINPLKSPESVVKPGSSMYDIRFFPEGGNLVAGINSKVAFKVVGSNGKGVNCTGAIISQNNDTVVRFSSLKFGMGNFKFTPVAGNIYKATIKIEGHSPIVKNMPEVSSQGYAMTLADDGADRLDITVKNNDNSTGDIYLFIHTRQSIVAAETAAISDGRIHFSINKSVLGDGISHLTVFNNAKQPVCERLYFKRPAQKLFIEAVADQQEYGLRKKVNINVQAKDKAGKPVNAAMSMSVYRVDSLQTIDQDNIFSYLWLNSELKGSIESPEYYFKTVDAETDEALDNLMLTQGWSRYQWNSVLQNKVPAFNFLPEYTGHIINAKIVNSETGAPAKNIITYLGVPGKRVQLYCAQSDTAGRLLFLTRYLLGPGEIIAQTNELIDSTYRIDIISPFSEKYSKTVFPEFEFNENWVNALKVHSLGVQVLNIYSGGKIKRYYDQTVDTNAFYGKPFVTYKLDDYTRFTTMEEDLREYVKEDNIIKSKGRFHIKVLSDRGFLDGGDPLLIVDGIPFFNIDKIFTVDPLKVRKLEVMPYIYYYGPTQQTGIFSFTTYKGDLGGLELDPRAIVVDYEGLQFQREFYSPIYDTQEQAGSRIPDFRNLLYWSPSIKQQGKDVVTFYTSDQPGTYVSVIQGLTANGDAGSSYLTFDVK